MNNLKTMTMKTWKQLWNDWKVQSRKNKISGIKLEFEFAEKDGNIYITLCGHAFAAIPSYESVSEINRRIKDARKAALKFEGLEDDEDNKREGL